MKGTVLVTGASGFVGGALVALLASKGLRVRAAYRRAQPPPRLAALAADGVELARADLSAEEDVARLARGVSACVHAAALASDWGSDAAFRAANVETTSRLARALEGEGAERFVLVGSIAVHGFGDHEGSDETGPYYRPLRHAYARSKLEAERVVLALDRPGFGTTCVRLGWVFGPGDEGSTYRMLDAARAGRFGWIGGGCNRTSMIHVDDACAALSAALESPHAGGRAFDAVGDETMAWRELAALVYEAAGADGRPRRLPVALARAAAAALETAYRIAGAGREPPLTRYRVDRSTVEYVFDSSLAKRLLGWTPRRGIREGLIEAAEAWRRDRGYASALP
ncbi:MAG: NAD-dependent epimerase/dehydratase family protein [Spirochaetales bacterium]|nr:NAD-dependent epimerase/dehydratase family protein [Spirochaetales bacterium]